MNDINIKMEKTDKSVNPGEHSQDNKHKLVNIGNANEFFQNTEEVGIEWFMNDNVQINNAVLKHRYSGM